MRVSLLALACAAAACTPLKPGGDRADTDHGVLVDLGDDQGVPPIDLAGVDLRPEPSKCPTANYTSNPPNPPTWCDGFEQATIDNRYAVRTILGTITLDPTRPFRGRQSLHLHHDDFTPSSNSDGQVFDEEFVWDSTQNMDPLPPGSIHMRFFAYLPSPVPPALYLALLNNVNFGEINGDPFVAGTQTATTTPFPTDQWVCVELAADPTDMTGHWIAHGWINEQPGADQAISGAPATSFRFFTNGVQTADRYDFWIDELIIDSSYIGCNR